MTKSTSPSAAKRKPADTGTQPADTTGEPLPFFLPPEVQNGTLRYDCVGNLEPSPGYTAVTPPDLQPTPAERFELDFDPPPAEPEYVEPRSVLNPAVVLPDDTDAEPSADAIRLSDLPESFPRPHNSEGVTDPEPSLRKAGEAA